MRKQLLQLAILSIFTSIVVPTVYAQNSNIPIGNEWIQPNHLYKKFFVGKKGLLKVTAQQLDSLGFQNVIGSQIGLYRDGKEMPLYVSTNGSFGVNDYIIFYGYEADGRVNKELYQNPDDQVDSTLNLFTDSATYFLTTNAEIHPRVQFSSNNIPTPEPDGADYVLVSQKANQDNRGFYNPGVSLSPFDYFFSSTMGSGEGWSINKRTTSTTITFTNLQRYTGSNAPDTKLKVRAGNSEANPATSHSLAIKNGTVTLSTILYNDPLVIQEITNPSLNSGTSLSLSFSDAYKFSLYSAQLTYPRSLNFAGSFSKQAFFTLPEGKRLLTVTGFDNTNATAPTLYDEKNQKLYEGLVNGNQLTFYVDSNSTNTPLFLSCEDSIYTPTFYDVSFRDYSNVNNQGDYIILTHKDFINAQPNYVEELANYRESDLGGGHNPVIIDVTELYDQFGYGYWGNPASIRNFVNYAKQTWQIQPEYLFIVGKGISIRSYFSYRNNPSLYDFPIVPTWGIPGSDNLLSATVDWSKPTLKTGRISTFNNEDIGDYLTKLKAYELAVKTPSEHPKDDLWKKTAIHTAGGSDINLHASLMSSLNAIKTIYEDTLVGGTVYSYFGENNNPTLTHDFTPINDRIDEGASIISFYGHAGEAGFDFDLNNPEKFQSKPKFPVLFAFGCEIADIFTLTKEKTISENYIDAKQGGAIALVAGDNLGYTSILPTYMRELYKGISYIDYGKTLGTQYLNNILRVMNAIPTEFASAHTQSLLLLGDPAINLPASNRPDFAVDSTTLQFSPKKITLNNNYFTVKLPVFNLGKVIKDSVTLSLTSETDVNGNLTYADTIYIQNLKDVDTVTFNVPINPLINIGTQNFYLKIDADDRFEEASEDNNEIQFSVFFESENATPIYPYEFSIVNDPNVTLKASTINAFAPSASYKIQIDTTEEFNSPLLEETVMTANGGLLKWSPNITLEDSTVYYWRVALNDSINGGEQNNWNKSSFIYLGNSSEGWNQSHFYQFLKDSLDELVLPDNSRKFDFTSFGNNLYLQNKFVMNDAEISLSFQSMNNIILQTWGCYFNGSIQIMVIDPVTGMPWSNSHGSAYGSIPTCGVNHNKYIIQFPTINFAGRDSARVFLNSIPDGYYVMISNMHFNSLWVNRTKDQWMADTATLGSGISLYHTVKEMGFSLIDSFDTKKAFVFFRKKGDDSYPVTQTISTGTDDIVGLSPTIKIKPTSGQLKSTIIGPATSWNQLIWELDPQVNQSNHDTSTITIMGIDNNGHETKLITTANQDTSLSFIDPITYPNIRLIWNSKDSIDRTSANLKFWRVLYQPLPEAALNPNSYLVKQDTIFLNTPSKIKISVENLSSYDMDSVLIDFALIDSLGNAWPLPSKRFKPLSANDTIIASLDLTVNNTPGLAAKYLYINVNPNEDQPEQYHPNNIGYLPIFVQNPLPLDNLNFKVTEKSCGIAEITWQASSEINIDSYLLEYSTNGKDFKVIRKVQAKNAMVDAKYNYTFDQEDHEGFYRLKEVSLDSRTQVSNVERLIMDCNAQSITLWPNPTTGLLTLKPLKGTEIIKVFSISGQELLKQKATRGFNYINMEQFAAGSYNLIILGPNNQKHSFIIIKK